MRIQDHPIVLHMLVKYLLVATAVSALTFLPHPVLFAQSPSTQWADVQAASPNDGSPVRPLERDGLWVGGGVGIGYAAIDCARCGTLFEDDPWEGGLGATGYFGVGRTFTPHLQAGAEITFWARRSGELSRDATLATIGVGGRFYPIHEGNVYLTVGVGLGGSILAGNGLIESPGFGAGVGAGYDISLGGNLALSPFVRFVQTVGEGASGRNRGEPALGPDGPRYAQFGIAFMRY